MTERFNVEFHATDRTRFSAWLYRPTNVGRAAPAVTMSHGFSATRWRRAYHTADTVNFLLQPVPDGLWRNELTLQSSRRARMYEPGRWIDRVSPTPLRMIVAQHDTTTPSDLALEAHGGLARWQSVRRLIVKASISGLKWTLKGWPDALKSETIEVDSHEQRVRYTPFTAKGKSSIFQADSNAIESDDGTILEERRSPRDAFSGHVPQSPWDALNLAYFSGYAMWGYLTAPFHLVNPKIQKEEISIWSEDGQKWRLSDIRLL